MSIPAKKSATKTQNTSPSDAKWVIYGARYSRACGIKTREKRSGRWEGGREWHGVVRRLVPIMYGRGLKPAHQEDRCQTLETYGPAEAPPDDTRNRQQARRDTSTRSRYAQTSTLLRATRVHPPDHHAAQLKPDPTKDPELTSPPFPRPICPLLRPLLPDRPALISPPRRSL